MAKKTGNPVGRPRIIKSPEEMDRLVNSYVQMCRDSGEPILLTGMILSLGLSSRESFDEYATYDGFSDSTKRAKMIVEMEYEKRLNVNSSAAGPIFALKNFGWRDKPEEKSDEHQATPQRVEIIVKDARRDSDHSE